MTTTTSYEDLNTADKAKVDKAVAEVKARAFWSQFTIGNIISYIFAWLFMFASWPWAGYVTSTIWGWFAVGQFGFQPITTLQAMAAGMLVACFSWSYVRTPSLFKLNSPDSTAIELKWFTAVYMWLTPTMLLFWAWVLKWWL